MKSSIALHALPSMPGVSSDAARLIDGSLIAPTARPLLHSIDQLDFAPGAAWQDAEFQAELRAHHERLGASASSLSSLDALAGGAACVVTGQQPGLLLGPLLTLYKILGAVALAEALSRASGRPVVPVYWCGSDDSDFDEVRAAWAWDPTGGAFRSEVEREAWTPGQRVGDVDTVSLPDLETATLERAGADPSLLDRARSLDGISGWGDRASAWALRLFAERGLVVVDARSRRLRSLGAPWFESYARRHAEITDALSVWSVARENDGWGAPIDGVARQSGLFTVEGQVRRKLTVDELRQGRFDPENVAPSVLLRPLWQDALLGPEVAVLGPSELRYHGQLRPLYQALDVRAARPAMRPHALVADPTTWSARDASLLLEGGDAALSAMRRRALPAAWQQALEDVRRDTDARVDTLRGVMDDGAARREIDRLRGRLGHAFEHATERIADRAAQGLSPRQRVQWYNLRGRPQERAFAATQWWSWWGDAASDALGVLEAAYVDSFVHRRVPAWALAHDDAGDES